MSHRKFASSRPRPRLSPPRLRRQSPATPAPDFKGTDSNGSPDPSRNTAANTSSSSGPTKAAPTSRSTTTAATWKPCRKQWTAKGVVWLSVISSAPGEQGYVTPV